MYQLKKQDNKSDSKYYERNDNIYYNVKITNFGLTIKDEIFAKYLETRLSPVIGSNTKDYYCTVARFKVSASSIPLFIFKPNTYTVTLVDTAGTIHTTTLVWVPNTNIVSTTLYVWSFEDWAQSVNDALLASYNAIPVLIRPSAPPFLLYEPQTRLFSIYATSEYASFFQEPGKTQIYMNFPTFSKFEFVNAFFFNQNNPNLEFFIPIKANGTNQFTAIVPGVAHLNAAPAINGITYYEITQQQIALYLLSDFDSLVITTNLIPVIPENYGNTQTNTIQSNNPASSQIQSNVLTDFQPDISNNISQRGYLIYNPTIYRWFDLPSDKDIRDIDFQIFWRDIYGDLHPIQLGYNRTADIKLLFKKKYEHVIVDKNLDK